MDDKDYLDNMLKEKFILENVKHPYIVNLEFAFV